MIRIDRRTRIDWPRIVANLRTAGMTHADIAEAVDVSRTQVVDWSRPEGQTEPAFWSGAQLLLLWSDRVGAPWTDAPTRRVTPSVAEVLRDTA